MYLCLSIIHGSFVLLGRRRRAARAARARRPRALAAAAAGRPAPLAR
jgi:hypothetical protein